MGHVTYMILLSLPMEYLGPYLGRPSMTTPPSHVFGKIRIFAKKHCKLIRKNGRVPGGGGFARVDRSSFPPNLYWKYDSKIMIACELFRILSGFEWFIVGLVPNFWYLFWNTKNDFLGQIFLTSEKSDNMLKITNITERGWFMTNLTDFQYLIENLKNDLSEPKFWGNWRVVKPFQND